MMLVGCVLGTLVSNVARYAAGPRPTEASRENIGKTSNKKPPVWPGVFVFRVAVYFSLSAALISGMRFCAVSSRYLT